MHGLSCELVSAATLLPLFLFETYELDAFSLVELNLSGPMSPPIHCG